MIEQKFGSNLDDAFEIIEDENKKPIMHDDSRVLLQELLQQLGTQKLIVEQEDIDGISETPPNTSGGVDGPLMENYFCDNAKPIVFGEDALPQDHQVKIFSMPLILRKDSESSNKTGDEELHNSAIEDCSRTMQFKDANEEARRFSINSGPFLASQDLSASVMLTAPLTELAKPIGLERRRSLPILCRECNVDSSLEKLLFLPRTPNRSHSTPVQSPEIHPQEGGEIETALSSQINLLEDDGSSAGESFRSIQTEEPKPSIASISNHQEEVEPLVDVEETTKDMDSYFERCSICFTTPVDVFPVLEVAEKLSPNHMAVALQSVTIYPIIQGKTYIKFTDLVFALIISTVLFWSYRESQRLRGTLPSCEQTGLESTQTVVT